MGIIDKTKEKSDELIQVLKVKSDRLLNDTKEKSSVLMKDVIAKSDEFISDDKYADMIAMAATKQEAVNAVLKKRGLDYRLGAIEIGMGIPPQITFKVITNIDDNSKTE